MKKNLDKHWSLALLCHRVRKNSILLTLKLMSVCDTKNEKYKLWCISHIVALEALDKKRLHDDLLDDV